VIETDSTETDPATADLGPAPVVTDLDTRRIGAALTTLAQTAIDRELAGLALAEQRWKVAGTAWIRAAGKPWPVGHVRLTLRAVAYRGEADGDSMTEEHHSVVDLADVGAEMAGGTLVTALGQLAAAVIPLLRARLVRAGVLERPPSVIGAGVLVPR
jgi:hypothetical protein